MEVVDFLTQAVVDGQLIVPGDTKFIGHDFGSLKANLKHFRWCVLEVGIVFLGDNQQMYWRFRPVICDDDDLISFVEYLGRHFAPDYAGEDRGHVVNMQGERLEANLQLGVLRILAKRRAIS